MENGFVSKTRRKKEMHALQDLGLELVALNDERLASLDLPEQLRQAVQERLAANRVSRSLRATRASDT